MLERIYCERSQRKTANLGEKLLPSHTVHTYLDREFFGKSYWKIHKLMDSAWWFCRRGHRRYWHDWVSAQIIASNAYPGDENAVWAAWLHIQTDEICSANPAFKRILEMWAKEEAEKRRRRKKKKAPVTPEVKKFLEDLEKLVRIEKMMRAIRGW
jgi:hypothetical protein